MQRHWAGAGNDRTQSPTVGRGTVAMRLGLGVQAVIRPGIQNGRDWTERLEVRGTRQ